MSTTYQGATSGSFASLAPSSARGDAGIGGGGVARRCAGGRALVAEQPALGAADAFGLGAVANFLDAMRANSLLVLLAAAPAPHELRRLLPDRLAAQ
jgi:hypothetical protein